MAWIVQQKDAFGTFHSTQATVLALKALLAGTGKPLGGETQRRIEVALDGQVFRDVVIRFAIQAKDLAELVASGTIARYQLTARSAVVYLRQLAPDKPLTLRYRLRATMPVKVTVQPAQAYEYYDPDTHVTSSPGHLTVTARG